MKSYVTRSSFFRRHPTLFRKKSVAQESQGDLLKQLALATWRRIIHYREALALASMLLAAIVVRIPATFVDGIFFDSGQFLYKAWAMTQGAVLYSDLGEARPPGILAVLFGLFTLTGVQPGVGGLFASRFLILSIFLAATPFLYTIGKRHYGVVGGLVASFFYLFTPLLVRQSLRIEPETITISLSIIGFYFVQRGILDDGPRASHLFASGVIFGVALMFHPLTALVALAAILTIVVYTLDRVKRQEKTHGSPVGNSIAFLVGGALPLTILLISLWLSGTMNGFLEGAAFAVQTTQVWHIVGLTAKLRFFIQILSDPSLLFLWIISFGYVGAVVLVRPREYMLAFWLLIPILLILLLPQSPGYPNYYLVSVPATGLAAGAVVAKLITNRMQGDTGLARSATYRLRAILVVIILSTVLLPATEEGITITSEDLSEQLQVARFIAENTRPGDRIMTITASYGYLATREVVNHFTFGPAFATYDQMMDAIRGDEITMVVMDPRTQFRLETSFSAPSMSAQRFSAQVQVVDSEEFANDGATLTFIDHLGNSIVYWVHVRSWELPPLEEDSVHLGMQVENGRWYPVDLDLSSLFLEYFDSSPETLRVQVLANANDGSSVQFLIDDIVLSDGTDVLFLDRFEFGDYTARYTRLENGAGGVLRVQGGFLQTPALEVSAERALYGIELPSISRSLVTLVDKYYTKVRTFNFRDGPVDVYVRKSDAELELKPLVWTQDKVVVNTIGGSVRETAVPLYGTRLLSKTFFLDQREAPNVLLQLLLQETNLPSILEVVVNGRVAGQIHPRNLPDSMSISYDWRSVEIESSFLRIGENTFSIYVVDNSGSLEGDFWRAGMSTESAGDSYATQQDLTWLLTDGAIMLRLVFFNWSSSEIPGLGF